MKECDSLILKIIVAVAAIFVGILIWKEKISLPLGLVGLFAALVYYCIEIFKKKEKPTFKIVLPPETLRKFADETLSEENELLKKTVSNLEEELARKDLPAWEQVVKTHLEKGELQKAIESINTDASDEEAAQKHIRKAQLYIANFQFTEAEQHYLQAAAIFPSYGNNLTVADFYYDLNKFHEAIAYYQKCLNFTTSPKKRADVMNNMGNAQWNNNAYPAAEASYQEALKIYKELAAKNPDAYLPDVAMTLNNLGVLYWNQNKYPAAEASYQEALKIRRELAAKNPDAYLPDVAMTLNNLGGLYQNQNKYPAAEASYQEALKIYKELAAKNPDAYLPGVAATLNNLGVLQKDQNKYPAAEASYQEALKIRRELAAKNPDAFLPDVAMTLNNLGNLQKNQNKYPAAEASYQEALKTLRELAAKNPDAYLPYVATTLNNLGVLYDDQNKYPAAEASYQEALKIYKELAAKNPDAYLPDVAMTLNNLGNLQSDQNEYPAAEASYQEALKIRRELAAKNPDAYLPNVACTSVNLSMFYQDNVPDQKLSLQYANETIEAVGKCNPTPDVQDSFDRAKRVIEAWN